MSIFTLHLRSGEQNESFDDVVSFTGSDSSGSFGIMAGHERMMTVLEFGLARFRRVNGVWHYLAMPGGVLYFADDALFISTRRYIGSDNYARVSEAISGTLAQEETQLHDIKSAIGHMEQEMTRRLWDLQRERA